MQKKSLAVHESLPYYVIKPTLWHKVKRVVGDELVLSEAQARPLISGSFITADKVASDRIVELDQTIIALESQIAELTQAQKATSKPTPKTTSETTESK